VYEQTDNIWVCEWDFLFPYLKFSPLARIWMIKKIPKNAKKRKQILKIVFFGLFFLENLLPYILRASRNFEPNPPRHLGGDSQPSPDRQTGFAVYCGLDYCGSDFSFAYLQIQATLEFGLLYSNNG
jgi:hypothetical protein